MPSGGWDVEDIARFVGANPQRMRGYVIEYSFKFDSLVKGRYLTDEKEVEVLLKDARRYGADPAELLDVWYSHESDVLEQGHVSSRSRKDSRGDVAEEDLIATRRNSRESLKELRRARQGDVELDVANEKAGFEDFGVFVDVLGELLVLLTVQQEQIELLSQQLDSIGLGRLQERMSDKASQHLHSSLVSSARVLKELGAPSGEVSVGNVIQRGSISVSQERLDELSESSNSMSERRNNIAASVGASISGLVAKIASIGGEVSFSLERLEALKEEMSVSKKSMDKNSYEGTFEIEYHGVKVKIGT